MSILSEILAHKESELELARQRMPLGELKRRLQDSAPPRDFVGAIERADPPALIAEVKRASPSGGVLREDFAPDALARAYEANGAACLSVLTDMQYFQGSLDHIKVVRSAVALPVMRKDFLIDEYQLYESRVAGADAILLIVAALGSKDLDYMLSVAAGLGMAAVVEVHDEEELQEALRTKARLIGINNRDLHLFRTDIRTTLRLIGQIPKDRIVISESGIRKRRDVVMLAEAGVRAVLVGEALVREADVGAKVRELLGREDA
jgi:indole-3-glycerol phosphate synthase